MPFADLWQLLKALRSNTRGLSALEYAIMAAAIVVAMSTAVFALGNTLARSFGNLQNRLT